MYLKALKLHGFKSFADPTTLIFEPGVTAVVGPNGCGKSNIADAIRWVLGEQSAKALRGGKMQDVIFEGADTRRPAQLCEVSMLLTECEKQLGSDFHEIEITRRVHRDGQGEYLFNGQACRLKDIHKLFMDTGVGRTSYSIMAQGQIDQILSSKPEERRAVFEEAAGITKYKSQRREAMGKLALTDQNLARVADVVGEVARQIGSLRRQASKAMRYRRLGHRLRHLSLALSAFQHGKLGESLGALEGTLAGLRAEADRRRTALDGQQAEPRGEEGGPQPAQPAGAGRPAGRLRPALAEGARGERGEPRADQAVGPRRPARGDARHAGRARDAAARGRRPRSTPAPRTSRCSSACSAAATPSTSSTTGSSRVAEGELGKLEPRAPAGEVRAAAVRQRGRQAAHGVLRLRGRPEDQHPPARRACRGSAPGLRAGARPRRPRPRRPAARAAGGRLPQSSARTRRPRRRSRRVADATREFREVQRTLQETDRQIAQRGARLQAPAAAPGALGGVRRGGEGGAPGKARGGAGRLRRRRRSPRGSR